MDLIERLKGGPSLTCPRRVEDGRADASSPFRGSGENLDRWRSGGGLSGQSQSCSYCGSMPPDDFMDAVRAGAEIGPTDKTYKAYVGGPASGKFYFQHLSHDQRQEFVGLLNAKRINIGMPGRFYVLPFFLGEAPA